MGLLGTVQRSGRPANPGTLARLACLGLVALLGLPPAAAVIVAGPYWELNAHADGTWSARTGASYGTAAESLKSIVNSWFVSGGASTLLTLRTNTSCALCNPPATGPSDYWIGGAGPLDLNNYPHPMTSDPSGVQWTHTIRNGVDRLTLFQRVEQGGSEQGRSYVAYTARVCNDAPAATKVALRLLVDVQSNQYGGPQPNGKVALLAAPPGPYPQFPVGYSPTDNRISISPVTPLGYVYQRPDVGPLSYIGLLNHDPGLLPWLPGPATTPDRFAIWAPTYTAWDVTGPAPPAPAGEEVAVYWWGWNSWVNLAPAANPGNCYQVRTYWIPNILLPPPPPYPDFVTEYGGTSCLGQEIQYTFTGTPAEDFTAFDWDFGDGTAHGSGATVTHHYPLTGAYPVRLTAYVGATPHIRDRTIYIDLFQDPCPPVLDPLPLEVVEAGATLDVCATARATRGGALTREAWSLPRGATFDAGTFCMQWKTLAGDAGLHCVWFRVTETVPNPFTREPFPISAHDCQVIRVLPPPGSPPADADHDGRADELDNCPQAANRDQVDADHDGMGDACEPEPPAFPDAAATDRPAAVTGDRDRDGVADALDRCPSHADTSQPDVDGDGIGDACDPDRDGDGILNAQDTCPDVGNVAQSDLDGDGRGDACDVNPGVAEAPLRTDGAVGGSAEEGPFKEPLSAAKLRSIGFGALAFALVLGIGLFVAVRRRRSV